MKSLSLLGLLAISLSATGYAGTISIGNSFASGDLSTYENRQEHFHASLSSDQLKALLTWLQQHRRGWHGMITEASTEPVLQLANLKRNDGANTSVCIVSQSDGGHYLRMTGPGQWAYASFGGFFKSWAAIRSLSDQEFAALENILVGI